MGYRRLPLERYGKGRKVGVDDKWVLPAGGVDIEAIRTLPQGALL